MRSKFIAAMVVVLSGTTVVLAQTKFSGTLQCSKAGVIEEHVIEVGDRPNHSLTISKVKCTFAKPIEIAGMESKEIISAGFVDISGKKISARDYWTITLANGDKAYIYEQVSGVVMKGSEEEGPWNFTGGTGKLKGIKGKGTYKGKQEPDGSSNYEIEGEYELPK
jgi:hypothetical protein